MGVGVREVGGCEGGWDRVSGHGLLVSGHGCEGGWAWVCWWV